MIFDAGPGARRTRQGIINDETAIGKPVARKTG